MISINNNITIGDWDYSQSKPYIIAEIGVNHEELLSLAKELIDTKEGGANAAKFQNIKQRVLLLKTHLILGFI